MKTIKYIIAIIIFTILLSCENSIEKKTTKTEKANAQNIEQQLKIEKTQSTNKSRITVKGVWYGDGMTNKIIVTKLSDKTFEFHSYYGDGSDKKEKTTQNTSGEYHTYNRFGEYYKLTANKLGVYDNQGFIEGYKK